MILISTNSVWQGEAPCQLSRFSLRLKVDFCSSQSLTKTIPITEHRIVVVALCLHNQTIRWWILVILVFICRWPTLKIIITLLIMLMGPSLKHTKVKDLLFFSCQRRQPLHSNVEHIKTPKIDLYRNTVWLSHHWLSLTFDLMSATRGMNLIV